MSGRKVRNSHGPSPQHTLTSSMPKPRGKTGPSRGHSKIFKRRTAPKSECDYAPESAIDREPDAGEPEDDGSTNSRIKIGVPVAMWVCQTTLYGDPRNLLGEVRISDIATQNAVLGRNFLGLG